MRIALSHPFGIAVSGALFFTCFPVLALASQPAFDAAGDSAYNSGWSPGSSGGFGWGGGWQINPAQYAFIGSSATNGRGDANGDGDVNSPRSAVGRAWGAGFSCDAIRPFSGPLSLGQTFSIDFDDDGFQPRLNDFPSLFLVAPDNSIPISVNANADYTISYRVAAERPSIDTGVTDSDGGIHLAFTKKIGGFDVSLTPFKAGATTTTFDVPYAGDISGVDLSTFTSNGGNLSPYSTYINNMSITPEPSSAAVLAFLSVLGVCRRRAM